MKLVYNYKHKVPKVIFTEKQKVNIIRRIHFKYNPQVL